MAHVEDDLDVAKGRAERLARHLHEPVGRVGHDLHVDHKRRAERRDHERAAHAHNLRHDAVRAHGDKRRDQVDEVAHREGEHHLEQDPGLKAAAQDERLAADVDGVRERDHKPQRGARGARGERREAGQRRDAQPRRGLEHRARRDAEESHNVDRVAKRRVAPVDGFLFVPGNEQGFQNVGVLSGCL